MLLVKACSPILHLGRIRYPSRSFKKVMAHEQNNWKSPSRLTAEPVLKVYNTLSRTKVRPFRARSGPTQLSIPIISE